MKTAEEWAVIYWEGPQFHGRYLERFVEAIQQDAERAGIVKGLRLAAAMCPPMARIGCTAYTVEKVILAEAERREKESH